MTTTADARAQIAALREHLQNGGGFLFFCWSCKKLIGAELVAVCPHCSGATVPPIETLPQGFQDEYRELVAYLSGAKDDVPGSAPDNVESK